jgi:hypothetical protein
VNKPKKHTPLTAEELVKLLDIHTNNEADLTEVLRLMHLREQPKT